MGMGEASEQELCSVRFITNAFNPLAASRSRTVSLEKDGHGRSQRARAVLGPFYSNILNPPTSFRLRTVGCIMCRKWAA